MSSQTIVVMERNELYSLIQNAVEAGLKKIPYPSRAEETKKLMTRKEAAVFLGITPPTITKLVRERKIIAAVVRNKYRFLETDLKKYLSATQK